MRTIKPTHLLPIILILLLPLAACQNVAPSGDQADPYGDLEKLDPSGALVVYWHSLSGADEDRLVEMIDDFNAVNDWDITVVGEYQGSPETLYERVIVGLAGGRLPSLVMANPSLAATYAAHGAALALDPYLESPHWGLTEAEQADFFPAALISGRLAQFEEQAFAFPYSNSLQVLYYNVDWLKGLGYEGPPETWEAFREMACAASQPSDGLFGFEMGMDATIFTSLLATQSISLTDPAAAAYTLGGDQGLGALHFLQDLINTSCALWETEEGLLADFSNGRILFAIDSTDRLAAYGRAVAEGANFSWALSSLPHTTKAPLIAVDSVGLTILHTTPKEQLAAWLFIKWLSEPPQQARWSQQMGHFPVRRSALETMQVYLEEHPEYARAAELLEQAWVRQPCIPAYAACRAEIGRMLYVVTAGESADQWLDDTRDRCNQALTDVLK